MLELDKINKSYPGFQLTNISLTLQPKEYFVLLGPSGVGKSMLLEIVAGLVKADSGRVFFCNQEITHLPPEKRNFGFVYQDYALFPRMNVADNMSYGPKVHGLSKREIDQIVKRYAELLHINHLLDREPMTLSGGEMQRVSLARAMAIEPDVMLLDEPLAALDRKTRRELQSELRRLQQETGRIFLHVTHNVEEALTLADRIGVLLDGKLVSVGTIDEVFWKPATLEVAAFFGFRNIFKGTCQHRDGKCFLMVKDVPIQIPSPKSPVKHISIRAENIVIERNSLSGNGLNQLPGTVLSWRPQDIMVAVRLEVPLGEVEALLTYQRFKELQIDAGKCYQVMFSADDIYIF